MRLKSDRLFLILLVILTLSISNTAGQEPKAQKINPFKLRNDENQIVKRDADNNGILVGEPKVYDDSLLQQMLNAAVARLSGLQILDQTGIGAKLGTITGANQSISSYALLAQGSPLPQVATTSSGATNSTVATTQTAAASNLNPSTTSTSTVQNTATAPVTNVTTTTPSVSVPTVTTPAPSTSLPTSFSVSASDLLNEQMQLTYEIANLRLLLEGSLNDRIISGTELGKPRVTLGFPIALFPDTRHKNAVAVVEVEIENELAVDVKKEPPAILALLPREKTYNVASITDKSVSIGGGVVTPVAAVAGSFLHGRKTYYLVQDQDTIALIFQPQDGTRTGFLWQFRPVLGAEYVKAGLKQTFVEISFPSPAGAQSYGTVHVRTYWRRYDQRHGLAKRILPGSLREYGKKYSNEWSIQGFSLAQNPRLNTRTLEDLGNGQMLVILKGRFLGGTYVRIGSSILRDGSPSYTSEYEQIRFVAPISDLATKRVQLVARDGTERPVVFNEPILGPIARPKIKHITLVSLDNSNTQLVVELEKISEIHKKLPLILVIGGRVFGYSDAPIVQEGNKLSVIVPTAFLIANPKVTVKALLTDDEHKDDYQLSGFTQGAQVPQLSFLELRGDEAKFLLWGNGCSLDQAHVVSPAGIKLTTLETPAIPHIRLISLTRQQIKSQKQLVLHMRDGLVFQFPIPSVEFANTAKPSIEPVCPVLVGEDEVIFRGDGLADLQKVVFNGIELKLTKQEDGKNVWVNGLKAAGVTAEPKAQTLEFFFKSGKTMVTINVSTPKSGKRDAPEISSAQLTLAPLNVSPLNIDIQALESLQGLVYFSVGPDLPLHNHDVKICDVLASSKVLGGLID